jgi:hypothetical protein
MGSLMAVTGWSQEELHTRRLALESAFQERPFACMAAATICIVIVTDILVPLVWLPVKLLCQQAEARAAREAMAEAEAAPAAAPVKRSKKQR